MRIPLAGSIIQVDPICFVFTANTTFDKTPYSLYTNYDVIAIGGGGGRGGGFYGTDVNHAGTTIRNFGGAGGGGGFHRVQGLLDILEDSIEVIVGTAGADGVDGVDNLVNLTDGGDGTFSRFSDFCGASGGKGGKRSVSASIDDSPDADGGVGGLGGQTDAGYGAPGGIAGTVVSEGNTKSTNGFDGVLVQGPFEFTEGMLTAGGMVGAGGGGGVGGMAKNVSPSADWAGVFPWVTSGGKGAYNPDQTVFGYAGKPSIWSEHWMKIIPGVGGGARITPLNGSTKTYGSSGQPGVVAIRLTRE